jgi:hypothetical protein
MARRGNIAWANWRMMGASREALFAVLVVQPSVSLQIATPVNLDVSMTSEYLSNVGLSVSACLLILMKRSLLSSRPSFRLPLTDADSRGWREMAPLTGFSPNNSPQEST